MKAKKELQLLKDTIKSYVSVMCYDEEEHNEEAKKEVLHVSAHLLTHLSALITEMDANYESTQNDDYLYSEAFYRLLFSAVVEKTNYIRQLR